MTSPPKHLRVPDVLGVLRDHASVETLAQMGPRYGIHAEEALGVPMAAMKRIAHDLGRDHPLAAELWVTGIYEARIVAALVDEPALVTVEQMDRWCADFDNWALCDTVCFSLFDQAPDAWPRLEPWARDDREFVRRASFALLWSLALHDTSADDALFVGGLALVEHRPRTMSARDEVDVDVPAGRRATHSSLQGDVRATARGWPGRTDRTGVRKHWQSGECPGTAVLRCHRCPGSTPDDPSMTSGSLRRGAPTKVSTRSSRTGSSPRPTSVPHQR